MAGVMTAIDTGIEVAAISETLAARRDPDYEWGMRRTVPSSQPAHATRVPDVRRTAAEWRRGHKALETADLFALCEALWATGWREERLAALFLLDSKKALASADWEMFERWSATIDNWEHTDQMAPLTGALLDREPKLLGRLKALTTTEHPFQRRLALVTLIYALRRNPCWRPELEATAGQLKSDPHALVRRAVVWARDRVPKGQGNA